jgi:hypothetical protein
MDEKERITMTICMGREKSGGRPEPRSTVRRCRIMKDDSMLSPRRPVFDIAKDNTQPVIKKQAIY